MLMSDSESILFLSNESGFLGRINDELELEFIFENI